MAKRGKASAKKRGQAFAKKRGQNLSDLDYVELVDITRKTRSSKKTCDAFTEIERRMRVQVTRMSRKFNIPGFSFDDIYQESLFALRYKAIKDYDQTRGDGLSPYPFDRFALLCIRRHLSTKLKSSYQNKRVVLNKALSIDQDRSDSSDEVLFLSDIISTDDKTTIETLEQIEYQRRLLRQLYSKLSSFEKEVLMLYLKQNSYEEIADKINGARGNRERVNVKSIDNARSRIKNKAITVFSKYGKMGDLDETEEDIKSGKKKRKRVRKQVE